MTRSNDVINIVIGTQMIVQETQANANERKHANDKRKILLARLRPSIKTCQSAASGTFRMDPSTIDSDSKKSVKQNKLGKRLWFQGYRGLPSMFPGRPSGPKNLRLAVRALDKLISREVRTCRGPTRGLVASTCICFAIESTVTLDKASAMNEFQRGI